MTVKLGMQTTTEVMHITFDIMHDVVTVILIMIMRNQTTIMVSCTTS